MDFLRRHNQPSRQAEPVCVCLWRRPKRRRRCEQIVAPFVRAARILPEHFRCQ